MIDVNETYSLPSELGELLNLYIQKKIGSKNRSQFEYDRLCKNYFFIMSSLPNKTRFLI